MTLIWILVHLGYTLYVLLICHTDVYNQSVLKQSYLLQDMPFSVLVV